MVRVLVQRSEWYSPSHLLYISLKMIQDIMLFHQENTVLLKRISIPINHLLCNALQLQGDVTFNHFHRMNSELPKRKSNTKQTCWVKICKCIHFVFPVTWKETKTIYTHRFDFGEGENWWWLDKLVSSLQRD